MLKEHHRVLSSTQARARDIYRAGPEEALISADEQTQGRGRRGNRWISPPGGVYFSLLIKYPDSARAQAGIVSVFSALKALDGQGKEALFKWPNDIITEGRKSGGMLIEFPGPGWVIAGLGVNTSSGKQNLSLIRDKAGFIDIDRERFIKEFCRNFIKTLEKKSFEYAAEFLSGRDFLRGRPIRCGEIEGTARGIGPSGGIMIESSGKIRSVTSGTLTLLKALPKPLESPLLLADIGNTRSRIGSVDSAGLYRAVDIPTRPLSSLPGRVSGFLRGETASKPYAGCSLSCVVPSVEKTVIASLRKISSRVSVSSPASSAGLKLSVKTPQQLGGDRIANAAAVFHYYGADTVVADLGTANTFDLVSGSGEYLGGVIAPGADSIMDALVSRAARLETARPALPGQIIGKDTESALRSGIYCTIKGQISAVFESLEKELKREFMRIITGGGVELLDREFRERHVTDENLTLKGLTAIWNFSRQPQK